MLAWNGKPLFDAGKFYNVRFIKYINVDPSLHGSVNLSRYSGEPGDIVTAFAVPDQHYTFDSYSITGAELTGSIFTIGNEDINIQGNFVPKVYSVSYYNDGHGTLAGSLTTATGNMTGTLTATPNSHYLFENYAVTGGSINGDRLTVTGDCSAKVYFAAEPKYNITLSQQTGGTIGANKTTGYDGDVVTLSNTADTGYTFTNYNVTGATLTGNQFAFNGGNVTAQGAFNHYVYNLTLQQTSGGTITADKTTGYYGDTITLSSSPSAGYAFDSYSITGATLTGDKFKFSESNVTAQSNWLNYNPLDLPPYTIRLKYKSGVTPTFDRNTSSRQVSQNPNVWDVNHENNNWDFLFYNQQTQITGLIEVLGANTTNVSSMYGLFQRCRELSSVALFDTTNVINMGTMFDDCPSLITVPKFNTSNVKSMKYMFWQAETAEGALTSVPLFDTHNVSSMEYMFTRCHSLLYVPEFDTSNVINMNHMCTDCHSLSAVPNLNINKVTTMDYAFAGCYVVQTGALNLYNKASNKPTPPHHSNTFYYCGNETQTGSAELAQIPTSWGGTAT